MFPLFNVLLAPLLPGLGIYTLHRRFIKGKSAESFRGQWGHISPAMRAFGVSGRPKIWLHAVSVGETMAARPLARALKAEIPDLQIALSSTTDTGHHIARAALENGEIELAFYFPLDLPFVVSRVLDALHPAAIGFVETELWPNVLHMARRRGIETFQLNGRVSDNLLKSAPKLGPLWKWMRGNVSQFLMRGASDAQRLQSLGVEAAKIVVTGDVKLEAPAVSSAQLRARWRGELGLRDDEKLLVAGSTHPGEEAMLLDALGALENARPALAPRLAIAPRHIERATEVAAQIEARGFRVARRSRGEDLKAPGAVFLLDSVGELADFYAAGDLAFVGGSLIARGGHNVLEPVLRGVPALFGPHMMNFRAAAQLVLENDLGAQIAGASALPGAIEQWLAPGLKASLNSDFAARVEAALAPHRGAAARTAQRVAAAITRSGARTRA